MCGGWHVHTCPSFLESYIVIIRPTKGFILSSGIDNNSSVLMLPFSCLSSLLNLLYNFLISLGVTCSRLENNSAEQSAYNVILSAFPQSPQFQAV